VTRSFATPSVACRCPGPGSGIDTGTGLESALAALSQLRDVLFFPECRCHNRLPCAESTPPRIRRCSRHLHHMPLPRTANNDPPDGPSRPARPHDGPAALRTVSSLHPCDQPRSSSHSPSGSGSSIIRNIRNEIHHVHHPDSDPRVLQPFLEHRRPRPRSLDRQAHLPLRPPHARDRLRVAHLEQRLEPSRLSRRTAPSDAPAR
jgi:hypothetical protein